MIKGGMEWMFGERREPDPEPEPEPEPGLVKTKSDADSKAELKELIRTTTVSEQTTAELKKVKSKVDNATRVLKKKPAPAAASCCAAKATNESQQVRNPLPQSVQDCVPPQLSCERSY